MDSGTTTVTTPVEHALGLVEVAVAELITALRGGGLDHHDQAGLLTLLDRAEAVRNQWQAVDAELLATCRDRKIAERECQRSMAKVLERRCLVTPGEAKRRMLAAEAAGPRQTPTGLPLPRLREHVSSAMQAGAITPHQVVEVDQTLTKLDQAAVHPDQVKKVESELVQHCRRFAPKELKTLCQRYLDVLDPDGPEPDEQRNRDRRSWRMHATSSGAVVGEFRLTPATGAKLRAILSSLSNPRVDTAGGLAAADLRTHEQRLHDAVDDLCSRVLRVGGLPDSGGTPATVIVTIDQADLLEDLARAGLYKPTSGMGAGAPFGFCPTCGQEAAAARRSGSDDHAKNRQAKEFRASNQRQGKDRESTSASGAGADTASSGDGRRAAGGAESAGRAASPRSETKDPAGPLHETADQRSELDQPQEPDRAKPGRVRRSRPRHGITSHGIPLTVHELLALAGEAEIYPIVLTKHGLLLDMGRERRIANKHQTLALIARDGGCSFPGCDHPPEWCERHHVVPWLHNGPTDLKNLTLLCSYHHHHFLDRGWQVRINTDGLPEWIPPPYLDPDQQPLINNRIIARIHQDPLIP